MNPPNEIAAGLAAGIEPLTPAVRAAFQTTAQRAAEIRALQAAIGPARRALQRLDERLARALRADRPFDHNAAVLDTQTAQAQVQELRRLLVMGPPTE